MLRRLPFYSPRPTHVPLILPDDLFPLLLHQIFYRSVMLWRVERQSVGVCRRGSLIEPGQVVGCEMEGMSEKWDSLEIKGIADR